MYRHTHFHGIQETIKLPEQGHSKSQELRGFTPFHPYS